MENTFQTKSEAINSAKEMLRRRTGVKRLNNLSITPTWSNCGCGETHGYNLVHITKNGHGRVESIIVSVCKNCG